MATNRVVKLAVDAALASTDRFRVGAVLYRGSKILGIGSNDMRRTHPKSRHPFKAVHAETAALIDSGSDVSGARIYVHRIKKSGEPGLAAPCRHCSETLAFFGIRRIEYSND